MEHTMKYDYVNGPSYKERRTDTHVYFVGGPFSQWYTSEFIASPFPGYEAGKFSCCEQFMMASKALLFHDVDVYTAILRETNPKEHKALGRQVRNFDEALWDLCARELVFRGNVAKFGQNEDLKQYLLETDDRILVEGASYDSVWGVKLAYDDPAIEDRENWKGKNWLGQVLTATRQHLRNR